MKTNIQLWTGISPEDQQAIMFESAYSWLDAILAEEPYARERIPLQPAFWAWWQRVWESIDQAFESSIYIGPFSGKVMVQLPGCAYRSAVDSEEHLAAVWRDFHHVSRVPVNLQIINQTIRQSIHEQKYQRQH
jgi:hypothetical protein